MKKKIVFVNQATGYITIDIINEFVEEYDELAVIYGSFTEQDFPLNPKVKTSKVAEKSRKSNFMRGLKWVIAAIQIHFLLITKYRDYEIFYFSVPPFTYFSSLFIKRKFSIMIFDVYPDVLKLYDIKESNFIYKIWTKINEKVFSRAYKIFTIGDALAEKIGNYVSKDKISVVPLWTGLSDIKPLPKSENIFAQKHNLEDKFVVQYSGNIGQTHNIDALVEVARRLEGNDTIRFLIIGRGTRLKHIKNLVSEYDLSNCLILPFQPDEMIRYSLAVADIGVVVIDEKTAQMSVPSKIYNILAVGSALLCIAPENSELNKMVKEYDNGNTFSQDDIEGIKNYILILKNNPEKIAYYKENSLSASEDFTMKNAEKIFNDFINK